MKEYDFSEVKWELKFDKIVYSHEYSKQTFTTEEDAIVNFWANLPSLEVENV